MSIINEDDIRIKEAKELEKKIENKWLDYDNTTEDILELEIINDIIELERQLAVLDYRIELDL